MSHCTLRNNAADTGHALDLESGTVALLDSTFEAGDAPGILISRIRRHRLGHLRSAPPRAPL